ncbi:MAG: UDP-N-acetylmuramate dehydrogenase [Clostridia bacterium]|nr:UDP-N-acetylmuramate dehydrogenase [Clostridia bacterium]
MFKVEHFVKNLEQNAVRYARDFCLKDKNTYQTGGRAKLAVFPNSIQKARFVFDEIKNANLPYSVLGGGSNLLVSDDGYDGVLVCSHDLKGLSVSGNLVTCMAGERVSDFLKFTLLSSLGGVEFLSGIPATVGGVVAMNAGCFGKNAGDYVSYVTSTSGIYSFADCGFDYRTSRFKEQKDMILSVCFNLENVEYEQSESKSEYFLKLRKGKQPKGRSCGSVFKNDGYVAGKVIESCALKGYQIGGAKVSERHANFIIADKTAKSQDVKKLIEFIKRTVKEKKGISLQEEIEYLGNFEDENQS